jgi:hypothetical protein
VVPYEEAKKCEAMRETGDSWDEPLEFFRQGVININFKDNLVGYTAGDTVNGTIDIVLHERIDVKDLVLEFVGLERSFLCLNNVVEPMKMHRDSREIIRLACLVKTFSTELEKGHYSYAF